MTVVPSCWLSRALLALSSCTVFVAGCTEGGARAPASTRLGHAVCGQARTASPSPAPGPLTVVQPDPGAAGPVQLAVQACAGLHNRTAGGSVFVESDPHDATWLNELHLTPTATVSGSAFLGACVAAFPACVRYDYASQRALLPNILTVAAALGAVPLDINMSVPCGSVAFDATVALKDKNTPALATQYVFDTYGAETTGLAMLNPGYDDHPKDNANPPITADMNPGLVDFVFSQKLFVAYLINGCIDGNPEKTVLSGIVNAGRWPTPLGVYGYNGTWNIAGGDLYEAQTRCLDSRNMGAIASVVENLSFYSTRTPPITAQGAVEQSALEPISYDPGTTYVAFVVGDGDNIQFMMTGRYDWFRKRLSECASDPAGCLPLTWTISPHLAQLAPDLLRWYYAQSHATGKDYFALPPSGHLYAYPTSLAEEDQDRFVAATEDDACILGTSGTVHWDWLGTWQDAEDHFLPKYASADGVIRGVFPVNVPYSFPTFTWWPDDQFYEILHGADGRALALFKPREWRGVDNDGDPHFLSPQKMAEEIAGYPKGTVTWVYLTSDGGLTLESSFVALSKILPPHVQLVSAGTAAKLALAAGRR